MKLITKMNWLALLICIVVAFGFSGCLSSLNDGLKNGYNLNVDVNEMFGDGKSKSRGSKSKKDKYEPELAKNTVLNIKNDGVLEIQLESPTPLLESATLYGGSGKCQTYHYFQKGTSKYIQDRVGGLSRVDYNSKDEDSWAPTLITKEQYEKLTVKQASGWEAIFGKDGWSMLLYFKSRGCPPKRDGTYKLEVTVYSPHAVATANDFKHSDKGETFTFELLSE